MRLKINYPEKVLVPDWMRKVLRDNQLLGQILIQRGIDTLDSLQEFLDPDCYTPTDPGEFPDMQKAVELVLTAAAQDQKICIYGDYDVDGVTSTTILLELCKKLQTEVIYHVPNRFTEGYGMNLGVIHQLAREGVNLIITCDCGISNHREILLAQKLGMTVLVTDHHHLPEELPPAEVILSPRLLPVEHPAHNLPGAGMAYFLALGVLQQIKRIEDGMEFLDLVALAIVADVVSLHGENRYLLQKGLPLLPETSRPGLQELFKICGLDNREISEEAIGFQLAPRLNAAGRMKSAALAVELLLMEDEVIARNLARDLDQINTRRKEIGDQMYEEAKAQLERDFAGKPIILYRPHWHEGILGITASKLCEEYYVPVLLMGLKEDKKTITGSARSIPGIHLYDALKQCEQSLTKFGGHAGAAGFSLTHEKLVLFEKSIEKILTEELDLQERIREVQVDGVFPLSQITNQTYLELKKLAPFGEGNPIPTFLCPDTDVIYHRPTSDNRHLRLIVKQDSVQYPAIWWWGGGNDLSRTIDLVYSIGLNRWQGREEVQLIVNHVITKDKLSPSQLTEDERLEFEIIDHRNWSELGRELPNYAEAIYYLEGIRKEDDLQLSDQLTINRYQIIHGKTLVLLSIPPGLRVLRELIYAHRPEKVVLAYSQKDILSWDLFVKKLMGLLKSVVKDKQGKTDIYQLAVLTIEMENTVLVGLNYLEERGFIETEFLTPDSVHLKKGHGQATRQVKLKEKKLKHLLTESRAFRQYLLTADTENIKKYIN